MNKKQSKIAIEVRLDDSNVPERIVWQASDGNSKWTEAKAFLLSIFDKESQDTLKIDLWTKELQVQEMDRFLYYTMRSMADTYLKATQNAELANAMQQFAAFFGEKTGLLRKSEPEK